VCTASLADVAVRLKRREVSPVEVTEAVLDRIETLDRHLNAFITVTSDAALRSARAAEKEITRGRYRGPLHGVPISLKDLFLTRGVRTTAGSTILADHVPERDATVVRKLRAAGAVIIGKANMLEFAYGEVCSMYGPTRNPWNIEYGTNGSSSGSAAAVAAGLGYASMGSDTGGSIRLPAAFCGIVGLKPTYGLVSRTGVVPLSWTLDHVGPITRTVRDCALVLDAVSGYDPRDPGSVAVRARTVGARLEDTPRHLTIGVVQPDPSDGATQEVGVSLDAAAGHLRRIGHEVRPVALPYADQAPRALLAILYPEASSFHRLWLATRQEDYNPNTRERLELGALLPAASYLQAQRARRIISDAYRALLREVDLLLTPVAPFTSYRLDQPPSEPVQARGSDRMSPLIRFTGPFDLTGLPAISVPVGVGSDGLPVGAQLVAQPFSEERLLQAAYALEQEAARQLAQSRVQSGMVAT
jgi:aspartyl-tRNA(Asn)/glutamyl-tRNA(Gln) amidotransferase subunit A